MSRIEKSIEVKAQPKKVWEMSRSHLRLYALCGVIAPIFFVLMIIVEGFLVPGYSHMTLCTVLMPCFRI
ncbi:MAG: hypothetical protein QXZ25_05620 [Candidatus Bathyarchaeia archaeon]